MTADSPNSYALVADIGGTNTRVALADGAELLTRTVTKFRNADHGGLDEVLAAFLEAQGNVACSGACVAIAGPVAEGHGKLTNLDWRIDEATLARATNADKSILLNDLQAQGHAVDQLTGSSIRAVMAPETDARQGARLVIGVGTGFNIAPIYDAGTTRVVPPSEAGHATLPVRTEKELALSRHLEAQHGSPAIEDMLSGRGLERLYAWLAGDAEVKTTAQDIMAEIAEGSSELARETAQMFVRMLGTVAGNLALNHLPFGGIYFAGGVARAFSAHFDAYGFADAFRDKGRFSEFMTQFPVHVIEDDFAALNGCARYLSG